MKQASTDSGSGYETKFVLDDRAAHIAGHWLSRIFLPDPDYPANFVCSIYFDTRDWQYLNEKENSDFLKTKVRLRWYESLGANEPEGSARLEAKQKRGPRRSKLRVEAPISAAELSRLPLEHPVLQQMPDLVRQAGVPVPDRLLPTLQIRYLRRRYVDRSTGARLSLDSAITAPRVNRRMLPHPLPLALRHAVLEIKAPTRDVTHFANRVSRIGCRMGSFSKYRNCCHGITGEVD